MPDLFNKDPILDFNFGDPNFNREKWLAAHGPESWRAIVDSVVEALKADGVTKIGTTGYCFGAPPAFYLAFKNEAHVTVLAHPSRLAIPGDFEVSGRYLRTLLQKGGSQPALIVGIQSEGEGAIANQ